MNYIFFCWLFVLGSGHILTLEAQSAGTFTASGNMITPRFLHTATLLLDGRVLVAGGDSSYAAAGQTAESSAELYDPTNGAFSPTGNMATPRDGHTATLLPNGKVLIAGGGPRINGAGYSLASAELYDPTTGTFARTGDMNVERTLHTATLLNDGKVLIAGGLRRVVGSSPSDTTFLASAELYDPLTGTFSATGSMNDAWADTATLLANGKVLITRGNPDGPPPYLSSAELYDPAMGTFTSAGYLTTNHTGPSATLLTNGTVLVAGGDVGDGDGASVSAEVYDPSTGAFAATGNLVTGREQNATTLLPDGTVLFAGGHGGTPAPGGGYDNLASAEIYNPTTSRFNTVGPMLIGRDILQATLLTTGKVLITGGNEYYPFGAGARDPGHPEVSLAELYNPPILVSPPVLLSLSGSGNGAILHAATQQIVSPDNPATAGEAIEIYLTGLAKDSLIPPQVAIGGLMARVLFFGGAPGFAGLNQVNVSVPSGIPPGPAVSVQLIYLGRPSNQVTIGLK